MLVDGIKLMPMLPVNFDRPKRPVPKVLHHDRMREQGQRTALKGLRNRVGEVFDMLKA